MKLHIIYDTETKQFSGGSIAGRFLYGLASVVLANGSATVRDFEGRDLLSPEGTAVPTPDQPLTGVQKNIAACFGSDVATAEPDDDGADAISRWDFRRWSR